MCLVFDALSSNIAQYMNSVLIEFVTILRSCHQQYIDAIHADVHERIIWVTSYWKTSIHELCVPWLIPEILNSCDETIRERNTTCVLGFHLSCESPISQYGHILRGTIHNRDELAFRTLRILTMQLFINDQHRNISPWHGRINE